MISMGVHPENGGEMMELTPDELDKLIYVVSNYTKDDAVSNGWEKDRKELTDLVDRIKELTAPIQYGIREHGSLVVRVTRNTVTLSYGISF